MKTINVAINGLGRIGRAFVRLAAKNPAIKIVGANDLGEAANLAYLLKYDSAYGQYDLPVTLAGEFLLVGEQKIKLLQKKDPLELPWGELGVDVVVESTGVFDKFSEAKKHLDAGAKRVVISAPAKKEEVPGLSTATILMGINDDKLASCPLTSNASCTTNAASPLIQILHEKIGIKKALLNTVHAYTATQKLVDGPDTKDWRRGRAGADNIVPSTTGAAIAVTEAVPELKGLFDGLALRVPVIAGSLADITFVTRRATSVEEVNKILLEAAKEPRWQGIYTATTEPLVSRDIIGNTYAAIADLSFTKVVGGDLVKVLSWYDNEMGYTNSLLMHVLKAGSFV